MKFRGVLFLVLLMSLASSACKTSGKPGSCTKDTDCRKGERCVAGKCQQCAKDFDCGPGKTCLNGTCRLKPGFCDTHKDCPDGKICQDHVCKPCKTDAECPSGRCDSGRCAETMSGSCKEDDDCRDDEMCQNGKCVASPKPYQGPALCALRTVYFAFNDFQIRSQDQSVLEENAKCIQSVKDRKVHLHGHCDPRGTEEYNLALSNQRAQAALKYLENLGIPVERMHVVPKGELEATGTDEEGWSKDRKVELIWY